QQPSDINQVQEKIDGVIEEFKKQEQQLIEKEDEMQIRQKMIEETKKKFKQGTVIKIDVGGVKYRTTIETVTKHQNMLAGMFSGKFSMKPESDGYYFIDRDGVPFRHILNYLRDGTVPKLPPEQHE